MNYLFTFLMLISVSALFAQSDGGQLSGDLMLNTNFYDRDERIGTNTTQYLHELSSAEAWLFLNYRIRDWNFSLRYDMFHNSPLFNPNEAYTRQGINYYAISKDIDKLSVTGGYFYDQIGSGIIFRAFEDRLIGLDYAVQGLKLNYRFTENLSVMAFTGRQKRIFDIYPQVIKGADINYFTRLGENISITPGAGIINRTMDRQTFNIIVDEIRSYPVEHRFIPVQNVYAATIYNHLNYRNFSLYTEYATKTPEATLEGDGVLRNNPGDVFFTTLNYGVTGFGASLQYKRVNSFNIKTTPYEQLLQGIINYIPPLTRQHAYRLTSRYSASTIFDGEQGVQAEVTFTPKKDNTFLINFANIEQLDGNQLFREYYIDYLRRFNRNLRTHIGLQMVNYNQEIYEIKPGAAMVKTLTPYFDVTYRIDRMKSIRGELQYLFTERNQRFNSLFNSVFNTQYDETRIKQDLGDFAFALVEFNIAPRYSFSVSDMVNTRPAEGEEVIHYYSIAAAFTERQTRFSLAYVKQVEGVVCTGGICRVEPAFSGLRFGLTTNF